MGFEFEDVWFLEGHGDFVSRFIVWEKEMEI